MVKRRREAQENVNGTRPYLSMMVVRILGPEEI